MFKSINFIMLLVYQVCNGRYVQYAMAPDYYNYHYNYPVMMGANPYYYSHQNPIFPPPGSYYDQRRGVFRPFPGGGAPLFVDYYKRCSGNFIGVKPHPVQPQYYYVCKPDSVIFGKCHNLQVFNSTIGHCVLHPIPDYIPDCTSPGYFPIYSDCHIYYKCDEELKPHIFICPHNMIFSPSERVCVQGHICSPTQIASNRTFIPAHAEDDFPTCLQVGVFRSPTDCSLYYKCEMQENGIFLQIRYKCPVDMFYDLRSGKCLPHHQVPCDCIPVTNLIYHNDNQYLHPLPLTVQRSHFDRHTLEEAHYSTDEMMTLSPNQNEELDKKVDYDVTKPPYTGRTITTFSPFDSTTSSLENLQHIDYENEAETDDNEEFINLLPTHITKLEDKLKSIRKGEENAFGTTTEIFSGDESTQLPIIETLTKPHLQSEEFTREVTFIVEETTPPTTRESVESETTTHVIMDQDTQQFPEQTFDELVTEPSNEKATLGQLNTTTTEGCTTLETTFNQTISTTTPAVATNSTDIHNRAKFWCKNPSPERTQRISSTLVNATDIKQTTTLSSIKLGDTTMPLQINTETTTSHFEEEKQQILRADDLVSEDENLLPFKKRNTAIENNLMGINTLVKSNWFGSNGESFLVNNLLVKEDSFSGDDEDPTHTLSPSLTTTENLINVLDNVNIVLLENSVESKTHSTINDDIEPEYIRIIEKKMSKPLESQHKNQNSSLGNTLIKLNKLSTANHDINKTSHIRSIHAKLTQAISLSNETETGYRTQEILYINKNRDIMIRLGQPPSPPSLTKHILRTENGTESINDFNNPTITDSPSLTNNTNLPRLEILAEQPLDVHFVVCPNSCTRNHQHNFGDHISKLALGVFCAKFGPATMMDEQLIDEVAEHAVIYNRQKYYLNGSNGNGPGSGNKYETKDEAWQVIAMKLRSDVETCKKRWKYLRERYVSQRKQGDPPVYEHLSRPYLEKMKFLDQHIQPRKSYRNVPNFLTSPHSANSSTFNDYNMDSKSNSSMKNISHFGNHNHHFHSQPSDPQHAMSALSSAATVLENDSRVKIEADQVFRDFAAAVASQQLQHISQSQIQQQAAAVAAAMADSSQNYSDHFRETGGNGLGSVNNTQNNATINGGVPSSSSSIKSPLSSPVANTPQNGPNNNIVHSSSITQQSVPHSSCSAGVSGSGNGSATNHHNMNNHSFNNSQSDDMDSSTNSNYNMKKPRVQLSNSVTNATTLQHNNNNNNNNGSHQSNGNTNHMIVNNSQFVGDDTDDDSDENSGSILHPQTILNEHADNPFNSLTASTSSQALQQHQRHINHNNIAQQHSNQSSSSSNMFSSNADFLFQLYQQLPHQQQQQQLQHQQQQQHHQQQQQQPNNGSHPFNKFQVPQTPPPQLQRSSEHLLGELVTTELLKMSKERRKSVQKRILEILFFDD